MSRLSPSSYSHGVQLSSTRCSRENTLLHVLHDAGHTSCAARLSIWSAALLKEQFSPTKRSSCRSILLNNLSDHFKNLFRIITASVWASVTAGRVGRKPQPAGAAGRNLLIQKRDLQQPAHIQTGDAPNKRVCAEGG